METLALSGSRMSSIPQEGSLACLIRLWLHGSGQTTDGLAPRVKPDHVTLHWLRLTLRLKPMMHPSHPWTREADLADPEMVSNPMTSWRYLGVMSSSVAPQ